MSHIPVMLDEVITALNPVSGGLYIDATFGAGGYSRAILAHEGVHLLALDRDPSVWPAVEALGADYPGRFDLAVTPFSHMRSAAQSYGWSGVDGVVLDIGVSSMQIDQPARGFSFMQDGPLDMRMSGCGISAADAVNGLGEDDLAAIFKIYGEERRARRAAQAIVVARREAPLTTTGELAALMAQVLGGGYQKIHPATRVFQALRLYINDELGELVAALGAAEQLLRPGGRLVVVTFHSLEDRIVKRFLRRRAEAPRAGSRHVPGPQERAFAPSFSLLSRRAQTPGDAEISANPRARSAHLRAAQRTDLPVIEGGDDLLPRAPHLSELRRAA